VDGLIWKEGCSLEGGGSRERSWEVLQTLSRSVVCCIEEVTAKECQTGRGSLLEFIAQGSGVG
jgi:hypothetical protein